MFRYVFLALFALSLVGCSTTSEWVRRDYQPKKLGVIRYASGGTVHQQKLMKIDAGDKMAQHCGGKENVRIMSEQMGEQVLGATTTGKETDVTKVTRIDRAEYTYVNFECK
jgi:outer membrane lipoprotein SlyB